MVETVKEQEHTSKTANCTFSGVVRIAPQRFTNSGINLVEWAFLWKNAFAYPGQGCPPVQRASPSAGQQTKFPVKRWSTTGKTDWDVVGEEI
jgi:hypothetical protein